MFGFQLSIPFPETDIPEQEDEDEDIDVEAMKKYKLTDDFDHVPGNKGSLAQRGFVPP